MSIKNIIIFIKNIISFIIINKIINTFEKILLLLLLLLLLKKYYFCIIKFYNIFYENKR